MRMLKRAAAFCLAALVGLSALSLTASAEGFPYTWNEENGGPHCESILMVNLDTNTVVYSQEADKPRPMASMTKIMSYIVAYENIPDIENAVITVPAEIKTILADTGSSLAEIKVGEQFTGIQMLNLMMVPSGNDAALTLARYVDSQHVGETPPEPENSSGSSSSMSSSNSEDTGASSEQSPSSGGTVDATDERDTYFVQLMNNKAKELGCTNTHFTNPHGLYNKDHYSSARDMAIITKYALTLPNFSKITSQLYYEMEATNLSPARTIYSTNKMLAENSEYFYTYATGIKTGSLNESGYCIVSSATYQGYTYIVVAMGSPMVDEEGNELPEFHGEMVDSAELFRWAFLNLKRKTVVEQGDVLSQTGLDYAWKKDTILAAAGESVSVMLPESVDQSSIIVTPDLPDKVQAPVKKGEIIGKATLTYADEVIATVPLVAAESVEKSEMMEKWDQGRAVLTSPWFLVIMAVIVSLIVVYIILVVAYRRKQKKLRRVKKFRDM